MKMRRSAKINDVHIGATDHRGEIGQRFPDTILLSQGRSALRVNIANGDHLEKIWSGLIALDVLSADTGTDHSDAERSSHLSDEISAAGDQSHCWQAV
jgi:hypothetical protein